MPVVVVTVTQSPTATATPTNSTHTSSLSPGTTAGVIIGSLLGGILFIALVIFLVRRYRSHKFARVANPHDDARGPDAQHPLNTSERRSSFFSRHSQKPSISSEPLIATVPPLPSITSRRPPSDSPPRLDFSSPFTGDSANSPFDLGEINQMIASGTYSRAAVLTLQPSTLSPLPNVDYTPPRPRQISLDDAPPTPPKQQSLFLHRMLKSRSQASEGASLSHRLSLRFSRSSSLTLDLPDTQAEERLLAEAERTALRDAEAAQGEEDAMAQGWESSDSVYSQPSASINHSWFSSDSTSRKDDVSSLPRRKSSRKRAPAPSTELPPVAEMPDSLPRASESESISWPPSVVAPSSLDVQLSHRTASPPVSLEQTGTTFPLLTSVNFGKNSGTSHTRGGSISSIMALGSTSSGKASRYPSLAASTIGLSSRSGPHSDAGTDWHNTPSGLAGLSSLQVEPLRNPHSPVEERPRLQHPEVLFPAKRAHLREGTTSSIPEVERREVMQCGFARIDVAL